MAVAAAIVAGDRELLRAIPKITERLIRYAAADQTWAQSWCRQLEVVELVAALALCFLEVERCSAEIRDAAS